LTDTDRQINTVQNTQTKYNSNKQTANYPRLVASYHTRPGKRWAYFTMHKPVQAKRFMRLYK